MRIGIWSDLHLHTWKSFGVIDGNVISRRLQDQIDVLNQILDVVKSQKIELLIFGGDLFHKRGEIPVECINIVSEWVQKVKVYVNFLFVRGNHDLLNDRKYHHLLDSINFFDKLTNEQTFVNDNVKIKIVNYYDNVNYDDLFGNNIVILHKQPEMINEYNHLFNGENWKQLASQNDLVFFGHYHKRIRLSNNCFIIGTPLPLTFDDKNECGMYIVDTNGFNSTLNLDFEIINNYAVAFVHLNSPKFITVNSTSDVIRNDGNYYKVLNAIEKDKDLNVISVIKPKFINERIKSDDFNNILHEWLNIHSKDVAYLNVINDIITDKFQSIRKLFDGRIESIKIKDFFSISDISLKIDKGFTLISGFNLDTNDSNGSGKSSCFEAVYWCLFGETTKNLTGDDVVRRGQKDCEVELHLKNDEFIYVINRTRKGGLSVRISSQSKDEIVTDGLRQSDRQIYLENNVLGFDKNIYLASCYFSQENLLMFTGLSDVEKTNMLTKFLGFDVYTDLYDKVFDKIKKCVNDIESLGKDCNDLDNLIENNKIKLDMINRNIKDVKHSIDVCCISINDYEKKIFELRSKVFDNIEIIDFDKENGLLSCELNKIEFNLSDIEKIIIEHRDRKLELSNNYHTLMIAIRSIENEIEKLESQILNLQNNVIGEKCDKCGSVISSENINIFIAEKQKCIDANIEKSNAQIELQVKLNESIINIDKLISDFELQRNEYKNALIQCRNKINILNSNRHVYDEKVYKLECEKNTIESNILSYTKIIDNYKKQISDYNIKIEQYDCEIENYNNDILNVESEKINIENIKREKNINIEMLEFWKDSFSPTGIRALLLDRFCNEFNSIANEYVSVISSGIMNIVVNPMKILKSGEFRNRIGLDILINNEIVKYESLSGGEKRRIDIALCLTLNNWVKMKYGLNYGLLGILILDELFSYVDSIGEESIANLLNDEGRDKAVYVVSHTSDLDSYGDNLITVIKEKGITHL